MHALVPEQPDAPTLTNSATDVLIQWTAPVDNGDTIISYTIVVRQSDGVTYTEDTVDCNGSDSTIIANL